MPALTNQRWERFAQGLAKGKTSDEAYSDAGFMPNRGNAARLKATENVAARVAELQERAAIRTEATVETIAAQLDEDREFARLLKSPSAAVAATMGKAKLLGFLVEKVQADVTNRDARADELDDDALAHIAGAGRDRVAPAPISPKRSDQVH